MFNYTGGGGDDEEDAKRRRQVFKDLHRLSRSGYGGLDYVRAALSAVVVSLTVAYCHPGIVISLVFSDERCAW